MRIATYNVEWFNALFDDHDRLLMDGGWSSRYNITRAQQAEALGRVFTALDADAVMIVEAPDSSRRRSAARALSGFAEHFGLRISEPLIGYANDTQQEIALLYDPAVLRARHDPRASAAAPRFDTEFQIDLDVDATLDRVTFSKPPLEVALSAAASGREVRLIGAHLKSKAPHGARNRDDAMRISIANRRKQLAQAIWLRRRVESHLDAGDSMIVLGDLNDGPGLDSYEDLFGRSSIEIVLGQGDQALFDPHAAMALQSRISAQPTSARFFLKHERRYLSALLDYIMVSPDLRALGDGMGDQMGDAATNGQAALGPRWRIWHPFDDPEIYADTDLREALLTASDHFPVTLDIDLG